MAETSFCFSILAGCMVLALTGCMEATAPPPQTIEEGHLDRKALQQSIETKGIEVSDGVYMIPNGIDEDGCETFTTYSAQRMTDNAIHYRGAEGTFAIAKDLDVCKVEMVTVGTDRNGCAVFKAAPVSGHAPGDVLYYPDENGRFSTTGTGGDCK